jgi:RHS repeat-associated protein
MYCFTKCFTVSNYRYGFNGKEKDKNINSLTAYDYGFRIYNPAIGKFLSVDPLTGSYPELTPYQFASNTPVQAIDLDGLERLDMTNINATRRTATITVVHNAEIVNNSLPAEVSALSDSRYSSRFRNTTLYTREIPQNGQPIDFITQAQYESGIGIALDIQFNVHLGYIATATLATIDAAHSTITMGTSTSSFTNNMTFAHASVNTSNTSEINPAFDAFSINGGVSINEDYEELIAHEIGFHNMMGLLHSVSATGTAIYPTTNTLESNLHNKIISTDDNVKQILKMNITTRQNLTGGLPRPPVAPVSNATSTPEIDESLPDHMKINNNGSGG